MARVQADGLLCDGLPHDGRAASWLPASAALPADRAPTPQHHNGHTVMRDPEGNEFCVEPVPVGR
jgi:hypothetical protein